MGIKNLTSPCICFNVVKGSQGSVATYASCKGILNIHLTANLPGNLTVKFSFNLLRFDRIMVMSLWPRFLGPPCILRHKEPRKQCRGTMKQL